MRSRTRKRCVAGLAMVGALALSGCNLHPGSAAVVNGSDISQSKIDDLVLAACTLSKIDRLQSGGTSPATSMAFLRNLLLGDLITFQISAKAAGLMHLTVSQAAIAKITATEKVPDSVSGSAHQILTQFFYDSARSQLQEATVGAHLADPSVMNADHVKPADLNAPRTQRYLTAFTEKQDVQVSPAYGTWDGQSLVDTDGSLSAPQSSVALRWLSLRKANGSSVTGLPSSQVCG